MVAATLEAKKKKNTKNPVQIVIDSLVAIFSAAFTHREDLVAQPRIEVLTLAVDYRKLRFVCVFFFFCFGPRRRALLQFPDFFFRFATTFEIVATKIGNEIKLINWWNCVACMGRAWT